MTKRDETIKTSELTRRPAHFAHLWFRYIRYKVTIAGRIYKHQSKTGASRRRSRKELHAPFWIQKKRERLGDLPPPECNSAHPKIVSFFTHQDNTHISPIRNGGQLVKQNRIFFTYTEILAASLWRRRGVCQPWRLRRLSVTLRAPHERHGVNVI